MKKIRLPAYQGEYIGIREQRAGKGEILFGRERDWRVADWMHKARLDFYKHMPEDSEEC